MGQVDGGEGMEDLPPSHRTTVFVQSSGMEVCLAFCTEQGIKPSSSKHLSRHAAASDVSFFGCQRNTVGLVGPGSEERQHQSTKLNVIQLRVGAPQNIRPEQGTANHIH